MDRAGWEREYHVARAAGTPDLVSEFGDVDEALEAWEAQLLDVRHDGADDVLALVKASGSLAVAYVDDGQWCAYYIWGAR